MHGVAMKTVNLTGNDLSGGSAESASFFSHIGSAVFPELTCSLLSVNRQSSIHRVVVNRHNVAGCE